MSYDVSRTFSIVVSHSKGFAYVEMKSLESLPLVLQLNDRVPDFQKFPVMVKASEAEKNYLAKQVSPLCPTHGQMSLECFVYCGRYC